MPNRTQKKFCPSAARSFSQPEPHLHHTSDTKRHKSLSLYSNYHPTALSLSLSLAIQSYIYIYIQAVFGGNDDGVVDDKVVSTER
jgi:hypothetical protein